MRLDDGRELAQGRSSGRGPGQSIAEATGHRVAGLSHLFRPAASERRRVRRDASVGARKPPTPRQRGPMRARPSSTATSSRAWAAPWPRFGVIAWAASPTSTVDRRSVPRRQGGKVLKGENRRRAPPVVRRGPRRPTGASRRRFRGGFSAAVSRSGWPRTSRSASSLNGTSPKRSPLSPSTRSSPPEAVEPVRATPRAANCPAGLGRTHSRQPSRAPLTRCHRPPTMSVPRQLSPVDDELSGGGGHARAVLHRFRESFGEPAGQLSAVDRDHGPVAGRQLCDRQLGDWPALIGADHPPDSSACRCGGPSDRRRSPSRARIAFGPERQTGAVVAWGG